MIFCNMVVKVCKFIMILYNITVKFCNFARFFLLKLVGLCCKTLMKLLWVFFFFLCLCLVSVE